ncbi:hypothetical protein VU04_10570, partial [Desulfobulbus sp. TB]|nr:hypothetical protein [Desulfobulbus sp. TB]
SSFWSQLLPCECGPNLCDILREESLHPKENKQTGRKKGTEKDKGYWGAEKSSKFLACYAK